MGSFNKTCSISRLPITCDMPMRAFVLARPEGNAEWAFYSTSFFLPLTTGLTGTYDDYGRIENTGPSENFDLACKHFFPHLQPPYDELLDSSVSEKAVIRSFGRDIKCDISLAYVREDVYQEVMKLSRFAMITRDEVLAELKQVAKAVAEAKLLGSYSAKMGPVKQIPWQTFISIPYNLKLGMLFTKREGDLLGDALRPYQNRLFDLLDQYPVTDDKVVGFAMEMLEHLYFNAALEELCISWHPTTNIVGQETPYDIQGAFNRAMHHICVKERNVRKAEEKAERAEEREWKRKNPPVKKPVAPKPRK